MKANLDQEQAVRKKLPEEDHLEGPGHLGRKRQKSILGGDTTGIKTQVVPEQLRNHSLWLNAWA